MHIKSDTYIVDKKLKLGTFLNKHLRTKSVGQSFLSMVCANLKHLTELWAELRKIIWHELPCLMLTHDVGDLLPALL